MAHRPSSPNSTHSLTFKCDCGKEFNDQIYLEIHQRTDCQPVGFFCELCDDYFPTSQMLGNHLMQCANKTEQCPICQKYIRRAIHLFHVENNCIDIDEKELNAINCGVNNLTLNPPHSHLFHTDQSGNRNSATSEVIPMPSHRELINTAQDLTTISKKTAMASLQEKATSIQEVLSKDYYRVEVSHATEQLQFNVILMGSPRVGKSQLINAICNCEDKAQTSASLDSCTKEVSCYVLEENQSATTGTKTNRVHFWDTPGIESWTNKGGQNTMMEFIEEKDPICVIYCAAPGSFATLPQVRSIIEFCKSRNIFWAFVCTNMWSSSARQSVIQEFEKELEGIFGKGTERQFPQSCRQRPHKVTVFGRDALCTMVNSIEFYDPELSSERKPVQGVDELILCIMEALDNKKLLGWCNAVLNRRTFWEKLSHRVVGFTSLRIQEMQNMNDGPIQTAIQKITKFIFKRFEKS